MHHFLNEKNQDLIEIARQHSNKYQSADPFPNIYFDNFFNPSVLDTVLDEFPDLSKKNATVFENDNERKLAGKGERFFGHETRNFMHFLNSEPFLDFLQILTGIQEPIISDPYFVGGGQHEIKRGGLLKVHADFNKHQKLGLDRRINVLVYLNKDWKDEYGGYFELWDINMEKCVERILPTFNTMAIFSTTDFSYHGHPDVLKCPEDMSRKSLALYYYSNGRPSEEITKGQVKHSTLFKLRKNHPEDKIVAPSKSKISIKSILKDWIPPILTRSIKTLITRR